MAEQPMVIHKILKDMHDLICPGIQKHALAQPVRKLDELTRDVLSAHADVPEFRSQIHIRSGQEFLNEISHVPEQVGPGSMQMFANFIIRNLDERLRTDFDKYISDTKVTTRLTGVIHMNTFGQVHRSDASPREIDDIRSKMLASLHRRGLVITEQPSKHHPDECEYLLSYADNVGFFDRYFKDLGANHIQYIVEKGNIKRIELSIPLDKYRIYSPEECPDEPEVKSETLSEPEAYRLKNAVKRYLEVLGCTYVQGKFQPLAGADVSLSLMRSYLCEIEEILDMDLPVLIQMRKERTPIREKNLAARNAQEARELASFQMAQGDIASMYQELYEAFEAMAESMGLYGGDIYLGGYGSLYCRLTRSIFPMNKPHIQLDVRQGDSRHDTKLCNTERNRSVILSY